MEVIGLGEQKWIITPQMWGTDGQPQIKISFLQPSQNADLLGHITTTIEAEAKAILIATMTEFQALGMGGTGSLALSRDKTDNFTLAVAATLTSFQESINAQQSSSYSGSIHRSSSSVASPGPKLCTTRWCRSPYQMSLPS